MELLGSLTAPWEGTTPVRRNAQKGRPDSPELPAAPSYRLARANGYRTLPDPPRTVPVRRLPEKAAHRRSKLAFCTSMNRGVHRESTLRRIREASRSTG